jgi:hypothetical protein
MFRAYPAHLQEVHFVIVYMQSLVSPLFAGDCLVHRLRKNLTGAQDSHLQRVTIPETAYYSYEVDLLKMSRVCSKHVKDFNSCIICK